jgi:hypothetical protein
VEDLGVLEGAEKFRILMRVLIELSNLKSYLKIFFEVTCGVSSE